jgi:hypothetical protein
MRKTTGINSSGFSHTLVRDTGLEPVTSRMSCERSTN